MKRLLVTIDGPAGAGKTTASKRLSDRLGYRYIDTGALYRGIAYEAKCRGISHDDDDALKKLCKSLDLKFVRDEKETRLLSDHNDITDQIRTPEMSMLASSVSANATVRNYLLDVQRAMGKEKGAVFEGRDMGTVVFPEADIKFFLDASPQTRALRRYKELEGKTSQTRKDVERDIRQRDENDSTRDLAPLKPAQDAILVDSTDLSIDDVVEMMVDCIKRGCQ
ncbi:MAG: (d)CMP kinase [Desulfobacterales bacterium]|nr:(d)CMP kinase [Desulfobacterales bacterium]